MPLGTLRAVFISPQPAAPMISVNQARAVPGRGIEGDRYFHGIGSFSRWPGSGREVSLIEQEAIDVVAAENGIDLSAGRHRRNLVTGGIALADLVSRRFRIGGVILRGDRLCLPCRRLERLTQAGTYDALKYRGGLRAQVLEEGALRVDDGIEVLT